MNHTDTMLLPDDLQAYSFVREILKGRHGAVLHKRLREDLRQIDFVTRQPCIAFLIKGTETFASAGRDDIVLQAGGLIAVPRDTKLQSDFQCAHGPLEAILIFLSDELIDAFLQRASVPLGERQPCERAATAFPIQANPRLSAFMEGVVAVYENLAVDDSLVQGKLIELLQVLSTLHDREALIGVLQHGRSDEPCRNLRALMRRYGHHNLSVAQLAALAGRSTASFNRDFKRVFGTSPGRWVREQRMVRARNLLLETDKSVTHIGLAVDYENTSHFIDQFRRHFGETPVQFRRRALAS